MLTGLKKSKKKPNTKQLKYLFWDTQKKYNTMYITKGHLQAFPSAVVFSNKAFHWIYNVSFGISKYLSHVNHSSANRFQDLWEERQQLHHTRLYSHGCIFWIKHHTITVLPLYRSAFIPHYFTHYFGRIEVGNGLLIWALFWSYCTDPGGLFQVMKTTWERDPVLKSIPYPRHRRREGQKMKGKDAIRGC